MIKMLNLTGTDNYQIIYRGRLEAQSLKHLRDCLERIREREGKVRLITRVDNMPTLTGLQSLIELIKMKRSAFRVISKYAILTTRNWIKNLVPVINWAIRDIEVKVFGLEEASHAIAWLNERD